MKHTFIIALLFSSLSGIAQPKGMGTSDPAAKAILDGVSAKFKTYKSITAKFTLKIENASGKQEGFKSGTISMKGSKYHVNVTGQEIFSDGSNIWTYDKSSNEVQISKVDNSASAITPQKMFTNFYDKDFLYKLNDNVKEGKRTLQEVELTPYDKTKPFFKVLLHIDKATKSIVSTKVFEKNGNRYTYSVANMQTNLSLPDSLFVFDTHKFPKVEVVDLR